MGRRIYVGNLSYQTTEDDLRSAFSASGEVVDVKIVFDRETGQPRGFGFVEMGTDEAAQAAIDAMNGSSLGGRTLTVNEARERTGGGGGFGGGRRDGGGGYGGGRRDGGGFGGGRRDGGGGRGGRW